MYKPYKMTYSMDYAATTEVKAELWHHNVSPDEVVGPWVEAGSYVGVVDVYFLLSDSASEKWSHSPLENHYVEVVPVDYSHTEVGHYLREKYDNVVAWFPLLSKPRAYYVIFKGPSMNEVLRAFNTLEQYLAHKGFGEECMWGEIKEAIKHETT